jgi:hypothetical protein
MWFFPLMVVLFLLSPNGRTARTAVMSWLPNNYPQRLGFLNTLQYFKEAEKHGIIYKKSKRLGLSLEWREFVRHVLLQFEKSSDQDIEQLLGAIVRYLDFLPVERCTELLHTGVRSSDT